MSDKCHRLLLDRRGKPLGHVGSVSADLPDGHVIPEHYHPEDQLVFASRGVMTVRTAEDIWVVPPLRAVWIPAGVPHSVVISGAVSMRTLYFLPGVAAHIPKKCFVLNVSSLLKELILHACEFPKLTRRVALQRSLIDMIVTQLKAANAVPLQLPRPSDRRAARIVRMLVADPGEEKTLDALCKDCGASKRTIQRIFIEQTKMTFARWRQQLRLLHAMQLLASGEKVIGAALEAGYNSPSAFISMFRKQLGKTPRNYFKN